MRLTNRVHRPAYLDHTERWKQERARETNARRDPVAMALYATPEWKALRASILRECAGRCATLNCARVARVVDHIRPHRGNNSLFFDRDNLQPLCKPCHDRKTARYDGAFGRAPRPLPKRRIAAQIALYEGSDGGAGSRGGG